MKTIPRANPLEPVGHSASQRPAGNASKPVPGTPEHEGATEDEVTHIPAPSGPAYKDEPKQG